MKGRVQTRTDVGNEIGLRQLRKQRRLRRDEAGDRGEQRRAQVGDAQARVLHTVEGLGFEWRRDEAGHRGEQRRAQVGNAHSRVLHFVDGLGFGQQQDMPREAGKIQQGTRASYITYCHISRKNRHGVIRSKDLLADADSDMLHGRRAVVCVYLHIIDSRQSTHGC